jgi:RES domain-containing protein
MDFSKKDRKSLIPHGGRWNKKGVGILYTSENRALSTVEYLVHVPSSIVPTELSIATIQIPDDIRKKEISISDLPANWRDYPEPEELAFLGTRWALSTFYQFTGGKFVGIEKGEKF